MKLLELLDMNDYRTAYYDPSEDEANAVTLNTTRKPVLTLAHLNRLKRIRAIRKLEDLKREDRLGSIYGQPDEGGGMGGMGMGGPGF